MESSINKSLDTLSMERRKELLLKKGAGWWVEFNDTSEEYQMMKNRRSYIKITKDEYDYFKIYHCVVYLPEVSKLNTNQYEAISTNWSDYTKLKAIFKDIEWIIDQYLSRNLPQNNDKTIIIDTCIAYGIVRDRLELIKPPQGKFGSWKTFLKLP